MGTAPLVNPKRVRPVRDGDPARCPVAYWMSRDQRVQDNWALIYAQELALEQKKPLVALFCLVSGFLGAAMRQYAFMLRGLEEVESDLRALKIPFYVETGLSGEPL